MSKYIDAKKLKNLIDEKWKELADKGVKVGGGKYEIEIYTYLSVLRLIDSLQQEQPEVNLEEETNKFFENVGMPVYWCNDAEQREFCSTLARHFYELGLNARKEE